MPRPVEKGRAYLPGLDGVRALAVLAVLLYHLDVPGFSGGLLGVGVFFTLSGYLITSLIIGEHQRHGSVSLRQFWIRRFRRLLPAVVTVIAVVCLTTLLLTPDQWPTRRGQALAALLYVANWHTIAQGQSYFDRFNGPGPLDHLWSLAVEEQFYIFWPLILLALPLLLRGRRRHVIYATLGLAMGSFALMALLTQPGFDNTRVYEGTDTRAGGLLIGAAAAMIWPMASRMPRGRVRIPVRSDLVGMLGLTGIVLLVWGTDEFSHSLYFGGLLALTIATTALVVAVCQPGTVLGTILGIAPLRWIGERSYGIYLWHLPVIVYVRDHLPADPILRPVLLGALTLGLAALSWHFVEDPLRRYGVWNGLTGRGRPATATAAAAAPAGQPVPSGAARRRPALVSLAAMIAIGVAATSAPALTPTVPMEQAGAADPTPAAPPTPSPTRPDGIPSPKPTPTPLGPPKTSCTKVIHIGDSTSEGLMSTNYLPAPGDRIDAQYKKYGAASVVTDIAGARSIVERWQGGPNAEEAVAALATQGPACWVLAMGTNDTANQYVGGVVPLADRMNLLLKHIPDTDPVLWVNVKSLVKRGPYSDREMLKWNTALEQVCGQRPNQHVYDWRSEVRNAWYIQDGIHFTTPGYRERASRIARALARAVPAQGEAPADCVISSR